MRAMLAAVTCVKGDVETNLATHLRLLESAAADGCDLALFPAAPGLYGRRTDADGWRAGHAWWEGSALGDARRHAGRLGLWIALAGQAGPTEDENFPGLAALVGPDGEVVDRLPDWRAGVLTVEVTAGGA